MTVLLVHGLGRTPLSLFGLAAALRRAGHRTPFFGYSPTLEPLDRIVRRLADRLRTLARSKQPVGLVGHSLGGLLLRLALPHVPELRVHQLVMLGTPNRSASLARIASRVPPFRWLTRDCGRFLASPDVIPALPAPAVPYTLVAGTAGPRGRWSPFGDEPNDGVVAVREVPIRDEDRPVLVPALHTWIMDHPAARTAALAAMMTGTGPQPDREGIMAKAKNVLGGPLKTCSTDPMTGFYRDGCCNTGADDEGLHTICCRVTAEFLAHQKQIGNDLTTRFPMYGFPGLKPGDQWCVCITRWKESLEAGMACPVDLEATHMHALEFVDLEDLQRHAIAAPKGT